MLIVIDDVWQAAHARPFLQVGPNCARLITTRNRDVLPPNAKPLDVDAMEASEAIKLLRFGLPDGEDATFASLAQRLGEWPLLLKLVNGALHKRLAAGQPLAAALAWVNAGLDSRGLTVLRRAQSGRARGCGRQDARRQSRAVHRRRESAFLRARDLPGRPGRAARCRRDALVAHGRVRRVRRPRLCARGSTTSRCSWASISPRAASACTT